MKFTSLFLCIFLAGCVGKQVSQGGKNVEGNFLQVTTLQSDAIYQVTVSLLNVHWQGSYEGGANKWDARKKIMQNMAQAEIEKVCKSAHPILQGEPRYDMVNRTHNPMSWQYGLAGYAMADVMDRVSTEDDMVPQMAIYNYKCGDAP